MEELEPQKQPSQELPPTPEASPTPPQESPSEAREPESKEAPRALSPEELAAKREVVRRLHNHFADEDIYSFEADVMSLTAAFMDAFEHKSRTMRMSELDLEPNTASANLTELLAIVADSTVYDALSFLEGLKNAVNHERYQKCKDWKVSDLEIKLL